MTKVDLLEDGDCIGMRFSPEGQAAWDLASVRAASVEAKLLATRVARLKWQSELERWTAALEDVVARWLERHEAVVTQRLKGPKALRRTRHWTPPGERKLDPAVAVQADRWRADLLRDVEPVLRRLYAAVAAESLAKVGAEVDLGWVELEVAEQLRRFGEFADAVAEHVVGGILEGEAKASVLTRIFETLSSAYETVRGWVSSVAEDEAWSGISRAEYRATVGTGLVTHKTWHTMLDNRVRPTHVPMEGVRMEVGAKFAVGDSLMDHPLDPAGSAAETRNCRCRLVYSLLDGTAV